MLFYLTVAVLLATTEAKFFEDCGSELATVEMVSVNGCAEDASECILQRDTNATITIDFTPSVPVEALEPNVRGIVTNVSAPFRLANPDGCKDSNLTCPLKSGEKVSYIATLPVLNSYPAVKVNVNVLLRTEAGAVLVCVLIPARIK